MNKTQDNLVSAYELAEILNVSHVTIYDYVSKGMPFTSLQHGRRVIKRFDPERCQKWIQEHTV